MFDTSETSIFVDDAAGGGFRYLRPQSRLHLAPNIYIESCRTRPNAWWRFWQWALLGWRWTEII